MLTKRSGASYVGVTTDDGTLGRPKLDEPDQHRSTSGRIPERRGIRDGFGGRHARFEALWRRLQRAGESAPVAVVAHGRATGREREELEQEVARTVDEDPAFGSTVAEHSRQTCKRSRESPERRSLRLNANGRACFKGALRRARFPRALGYPAREPPSTGTTTPVT